MALQCTAIMHVLGGKDVFIAAAVTSSEGVAFSFSPANLNVASF